MAVMSRNIGNAERAVRALLGIAILSLVFVGPRTPWAWLGIIPILTALSGWCPLYTALGISRSGKAAK